MNRSIKSILFIFLLSLALYVGTFLYLFKMNYHQFNTEIYQRSKDNIEIIDLVAKVETHLYIHKKSLFRFLNTGDPKWISYLKDSEKGIEKYFKFMSEYNKDVFQFDSATSTQEALELRRGLEGQIQEFQKGRSGGEHFQKLFALVSANLNLYFKQANDQIQKYMALDTAATPGVIAIDDEEAYAGMIMVGLDQMITGYNNLFWDYTEVQNQRYTENNTFYFRALMLSSVIVFLFAIFVVVSVFKYFYKKEEHAKNLSLLGAKDIMTGLYKRDSFEIFCTQELDRARRKKRPVCLLVIRLEAYDKMKRELTEVSIRRTLYQLGDVLQKTFRAYDGVFKFDENTFVALFTETNSQTIHTIVKRLKQKLQKVFLTEEKERAKELYAIGYGFAVYPTHGEDTDKLVAFALSRISAEGLKESQIRTALKPAGSLQGTDSQQVGNQPALSSEPDKPPYEPEIDDDTPEWIKEEIRKLEGTVGLDDMFAKGEGDKPPSDDYKDDHQDDHKVEVVIDQGGSVEEVVPEDQGPEIPEDEVHAEEFEDNIPDVVAALSQGDPEPPRQIDQGSDDALSHISNIEVVKPDDGEDDIIMVDFESEKDDLAMSFRKKLKDKRKKQEQV